MSCHDHGRDYRDCRSPSRRPGQDNSDGIFFIFVFIITLLIMLGGC